MGMHVGYAIFYYGFDLTKYAKHLTRLECCGDYPEPTALMDFWRSSPECQRLMKEDVNLAGSSDVNRKTVLGKRDRPEEEDELSMYGISIPGEFKFRFDKLGDANYDGWKVLPYLYFAQFSLACELPEGVMFQRNMMKDVEKLANPHIKTARMALKVLGIKDYATLQPAWHICSAHRKD
ncbi:hypothetical protein K493DRAFT_314993 [Basidiobolus meristosporus CBS 931.73]|uniref:Uncharacterized protein n=1 Tax=Basidiobolus meristosporus CBS 931.73 TaxID=1314790 RepID=A0A1Y1YBU0_9FUNG|nr:hypothetical protein K493DRAFT_314993 [Basidiobolus meristosporus CBS 931.73]|eukprot:ORX95469.1 hypothetical protein K493DRAFT_314993 [Basidiobolus meristosporus CBS 931.73]